MSNRNIIYFLLAVLFLPTVAFAAVTIPSIVQAAVVTTLWIASGVVVILWVITGLLFLTARGDPGKVVLARNALIAAVAGTLLVVLANSAIPLVRNAFGV